MRLGIVEKSKREVKKDDIVCWHKTILWTDGFANEADVLFYFPFTLCFSTLSYSVISVDSACGTSGVRVR